MPGYERVFNGIELTGRKRMSNRWMMNTSFTYNATDVHFDDFAGAANQSSGTAGTIPISEDPTNRTVREGGQYRLPRPRAAASATSMSTRSGCSS